MGKIQNNQQGFSVIETLLVIVVIGILGFVGWFVWHAQQTTNKTLQTTNDTQTTNTGTPKTRNTLKVPALRIELVNVPDNLKDLVFAVNLDDENGAQVDFSTATLTKLDPNCSPTANVSDIGFLGRGPGNSKSNQEVLHRVVVKQFDGFYIFFSPKTGKCSDVASTEALHKQQQAEFKKLVTTPANLQPLN